MIRTAFPCRSAIWFGNPYTDRIEFTYAYEGTDALGNVKITLPNLNIKTERKESENTGFESSTEEEKVIELAKEQGGCHKKRS